MAGVAWGGADPRRALNGDNTGILKYTQLGHISIAVTHLSVMQEVSGAITDPNAVGGWGKALGYIVTTSPNYIQYGNN